MENETQMYFATNPDAKHDEHLINYQLDEYLYNFILMLVFFLKPELIMVPVSCLRC